MKRILKASVSMLALYLLGGAVLDRFVFPEPAPDESYYPPVGYVFASKMEGFEQRILQREDGIVLARIDHGPQCAGTARARPHVFLGAVYGR